MTGGLAALLADVRLSPEGTGEEGIATAEQEMDCKLPAEVKSFLLEHDGGEGTLGPRGRPIQLWPLARILCCAQWSLIINWPQNRSPARKGMAWPSDSPAVQHCARRSQLA